jgi:hypothetical protein
VGTGNNRDNPLRVQETATVDAFLRSRRARQNWAKKGDGGRSTGTSAVPQITDELWCTTKVGRVGPIADILCHFRVARPPRETPPIEVLLFAAVTLPVAGQFNFPLEI